MQTSIFFKINICCFAAVIHIKIFKFACLNLHMANQRMKLHRYLDYFVFKTVFKYASLNQNESSEYYNTNTKA